MPIINETIWETYVDKNKDDYGKACVDVARRVMEILDTNTSKLYHGYAPDLNTPHGIICKADDDIGAGGITGFMASCVVAMIRKCHSRGEEFFDANQLVDK